MSFKIDFHVHTENSDDAFGSLKEISYFAKKRDIKAVAVADHNKFTIDAVSEVEGVFFIPAIELKTFAGHIICLLPKEHFDPTAAYSDPIRYIHQVGGHAILAHPYGQSYIRKQKVNITPDAIEVYNSASFPFGSSSRKAWLLAEEMHLPKTAGSDAHMPKHVGLCYVEVNAGSLNEALDEVFQGNGVLHGEARTIREFIQLNIVRVLKRKF
ncbi:MAG: PHP domain-containing protein [Nitrososphaeria archaeon]|jgi:predicted metal-dependent phosphoesterase TrpH